MTKEINRDDFNHPDVPPSGIHMVTHTANKELWAIHFEPLNCAIYLHVTEQSYKDYTGADHFGEDSYLRACVLTFKGAVHICIPEFKDAYMTTIVHECIHAVYRQFEILGIHADAAEHEILAYCVEFLAEKIGTIQVKLLEESGQLKDINMSEIDPIPMTGKTRKERIVEDEVTGYCEQCADVLEGKECVPYNLSCIECAKRRMQTLDKLRLEADNGKD